MQWSSNYFGNEIMIYYTGLSRAVCGSSFTIQTMEEFGIISLMHLQTQLSNPLEWEE